MYVSMYVCIWIITLFNAGAALFSTAMYFSCFSQMMLILRCGFKDPLVLEYRPILLHNKDSDAILWQVLC